MSALYVWFGCRALVQCYGLVRVAPNLPGVRGLVVPTPGMLLEFCQGGSLRESMTQAQQRDRRTLDGQQALGWLADVAAALHFLHTSRPAIIHRDIKADNVLLQYDTQEGRMVAKLADLGLHVVGFNRRWLSDSAGFATPAELRHPSASASASARPHDLYRACNRLMTVRRPSLHDGFALGCAHAVRRTSPTSFGALDGCCLLVFLGRASVTTALQCSAGAEAPHPTAPPARSSQSPPKPP